MIYNPAEQAKKNVQMTKGQMQQFGTLTEKQKQDLANREVTQTNNARQAADRARLAAGVGDAAGLTSTGGQLEYTKATMGSPKNTSAGSYNVSSEKNTAVREQQKGQNVTPTPKPTPKPTPSGSTSETWQDRVRNATASDADMEEAFRAWQEGKYRPGPKTLEYFKKMGWMQPIKPNDAPTITPPKPAKKEGQAY